MQRAYLLLVTLIALSSITACSVPINLQNTTTNKVIDEPKVGEIVTRSIGERLVAKGVKTVGPGIRLIDNVQFKKAENEPSVATCALTIPAGGYFRAGAHARTQEATDCYGPVTVHATLSDGSTNGAWGCSGRVIPQSAYICNNQTKGFFLALSGSPDAELKQDFELIRKENLAVTNAANFVQELIYNGRAGDQLKFVYREFARDILRPAFTQEVQYDLKRSNIIGFKELRITVLEATNTEITYRVDVNFGLPQQPEAKH